jgi:pSer/pThr/pTyr-binding forkhead associated (FHA) protein
VEDLMKIICDNCMGENCIDESELDTEGFKFECKICGHIIYVDVEDVCGAENSGHEPPHLQKDSDSCKNETDGDAFIRNFPISSLSADTTMPAVISRPDIHTAPACITVIDGPDSGKVVQITSNRLVLGRKGADINLNDRLVSRRHALLESGSGRYLLKDLGSTNGTFLNGMPVGMEFLRNGDEIQLGSTLIRFSIVDVESTVDE